MTPKARVYDIIMLLGDSLTQRSGMPGGLAQRLADDYLRRLDVLNRGFGGYQTEWAIPVFKEIFPMQDGRLPKVQLLIIWLGANDAAVPPSPQHIPHDKYQKNLETLVEMVRSPTSAYYSPCTRIILITPPPVNTHVWRAHRDFKTTESYAQTTKKVGEGLQIPVADVWTMIWEACGKEERALDKYLDDGLHLNAAGYEIVHQAVMRIIEEKYPDIHPDKLKFVFPWWVELVEQQSVDSV